MRVSVVVLREATTESGMAVVPPTTHAFVAPSLVMAAAVAAGTLVDVTYRIGVVVPAR